MSFIERYHNSFICLVDWAIRTFYYYPAQQGLIDKYFEPFMRKDSNDHLPNVYALERKVAIIMINSHVALDHPRPSMPNIVNVGGLHLRATNPLPKELQSFIDDAHHGVIYFSFGSNIQGSDMPQRLQETFIETFKNLPQRVLWKFEGKIPSNVPSNVLIWKWFPQHDILAHPNIVLFITHGGLFSLQESLYNGIPMLIIPFFNDQFKNAERSQREGYGLRRYLHEINNKTLITTIKELINNRMYRQRAQEVSEIFKDNLSGPMETAIYWIEYVAKHKKAREFLISKAVKLYSWEFFMLDVIFVTLTLACILVWCTKILFRQIKFFFNTKKIQKVKIN